VRVEREKKEGGKKEKKHIRDLETMTVEREKKRGGKKEKKPHTRP